MTLRSDVLAYIPSPAQGVWNLGPFPLRAYALCIILGIIVAIWWGERRWQERGGNQGTVLDVAMFAVPFGLVGGRLYHVATDWEKYFGEGARPIEALYIWQGGLGIWGAVFLGGVGAWLACRIYRIPLPAFGDAIAPPVLLAQAIGRLGNWFNQELYGRETTVPWGLEIYPRFDANGDPDAMAGVSNGVVEKVVHPTFLYELLWNVLVVVLLVLIDKRYRIGHGRLFALYVAGYSFGRFFVELMRDDEATEIFGIRINNFTSALVFLAAIAYVVFATKGREAPDRLQPGASAHPWPWELKKLRAAGLEANTPVSADQADEQADAEANADSEKQAASTVDTAKAASDERADKAASDKTVSEKTAAKVSDADKPDTSKPDAGKVDTGKVDTGKADSDKADSDKAGPDKADVAQADTDKAQADKADAVQVDTDKAETDKADSEKSDGVQADTVKPSAAEAADLEETGGTAAENSESPAAGTEKTGTTEESERAGKFAEAATPEKAAGAGKSRKAGTGGAE